MRSIVILFSVVSLLLTSNVSFGTGGIGVDLRAIKAKDGQFFNLMIENINPSSPASKSGLQAGDIISAINGQNTYNRFSTQEDFNYLISLLRGTPGSEVSVTINRKTDYWLWKGEKSKTFNLVRFDMGNLDGPSQNNPSVAVCVYSKKVKLAENVYPKNRMSIYEASARVETFINVAKRVLNMIENEPSCHQETIRVNALLSKAYRLKRQVDMNLEIHQKNLDLANGMALDAIDTWSKALAR